MWFFDALVVCALIGLLPALVVLFLEGIEEALWSWLGFTIAIGVVWGVIMVINIFLTWRGYAA